MRKQFLSGVIVKSVVGLLAIGCLANVLIAWTLAWINRLEVLPEKQVIITLKDWPMPPPSGWPQFVRSADPQVAETEWVLFGASRIGAGTESGNVSYTMNTRTAGLPFRSLIEGSCSEYTPPNTMKQTERGKFGPFPICPLWTGFALNTLFYAAIAWGLWQVPHVSRRRRRKAKGLCVRCGYDLKGIAAESACPECGTQP